MTTRNHAVIWIDHLVAKVFFVGLGGVDEVLLHSKLPTEHLHHKANSIGSGHVEDDQEFLRRVADTVRPSEEILVLGPGLEKTALVSYLHEHWPAVSKHVVRVESCDHPTDPEIVTRAKRYFKLG